jgi:RNA polymerase sigma-70 factor (ECF subfamily)
MDVLDDFASRFARLARMLRRHCGGHDEAEDAVQEAYVRLLNYIQAGKKVVEPEAFLVRTAYNASIDARRSRRAHLQVPRPLEKLHLTPDLTADPQEHAADEQLLQRTKAILESALGARARDVFVMHCFDGFTYEEIAKQINMSTRTVEKDLLKAINVLSLADIPKP